MGFSDFYGTIPRSIYDWYLLQKSDADFPIDDWNDINIIKIDREKIIDEIRKTRSISFIFPYLEEEEEHLIIEYGSIDDVRKYLTVITRERLICWNGIRHLFALGLEIRKEEAQLFLDRLLDDATWAHKWKNNEEEAFTQLTYFLKQGAVIQDKHRKDIAELKENGVDIVNSKSIPPSID